VVAFFAAMAVLHHARGTGDPGFWVGLTAGGLVVPDILSEFVRGTRR
jgi:hypothetical protein